MEIGALRALWAGGNDKDGAGLFVGFEEQGDEFVEVSAPDAPVVCAVGDVRDVFDSSGFEGFEEPGVGIKEKILPAAADPQQLEAGVCQVGV